jgi:hypothetical protein
MRKGRYAIVAKKEVEIVGLGGFESRVQPHLLPFTAQYSTQEAHKYSEPSEGLQWSTSLCGERSDVA